MPTRPVVVVPAAALDDALDAIDVELGVPHGFPADVLAEAEASAARGPDPAVVAAAADRREIPFVTIDPPGSRDLDQAFHAHRTPGGGYRVHYAIADVAAFVSPGGAVDAEAHRRGLTRYEPGRRASLHPEVLSQGAASLLPDGDRPALLWTIDLDADGAPVGEATLERVVVRSRRMRTYADVQAELDAGTAGSDEPITLLREIGRLREEQETARGGISLRLPTQAVQASAHGATLVFERPLRVEDWNAQISLLTGFVAADRMLDAGVGVLRTLPPPDPRDVDRLRQAAHALGHPWPKGTRYPDFVRSIDPEAPSGASLLNLAARTMRGAGYAAFDGAVPDQPDHAALASPYAHVTAPLRRLVDRYANEILLATGGDRRPPDWVLGALDALPAEMAAAGQRERALERAVLDAAEALLLAARVGDDFPGTVVADNGKHRWTVQIPDPAISATVTWPRPGAGVPAPELGAPVVVTLTAADPTTRTITFVPG